MNNRGQVVLLALMLGAVILVVTIALSPVIKEISVEARNVSSGDRIGLDCGNSSISDFDKSTCVITDLYLPYFLISVLGLVGILVGARIILG